MRADVFASFAFRASNAFFSSSTRTSRKRRVLRFVAVSDAGIQALESRVLLSTSLPASLLKVVNPALNDASPTDLTVSNGELYFVANGGGDGQQLWKSDGTAAGTELVANPISEGRTTYDLTDMGGTLYYFDTGIDNQTSYFMRSDGTTAGTAIVATVYNAEALTNVNGTAYFFAQPDSSSASPWELFRSDGTAAGTVAVATTGSANSATDFNGELYFTIGSALWKSDGTGAGTVPVATVGTGSDIIEPIVSASGRLFIVTGAANSAQSLWVSDGTAAGTSLVKAFDYIIGRSIAYQGDLYFSAADANQQMGLWKSDGTAAGTSLVSDIPALSYLTPASSLAVLNNLLYFEVGDPATSYPALWRTDGTAQGTVDVSSVLGSSTLWSWSAASYNNKLYFDATDSIHGVELWVTDGTAANTCQVAQINSTQNLGPLAGDTVTIGGETYFSVYETGSGFNAGGPEGLWKTDGTAAGTVQISSVEVGSGPLTSAGDLVNAGGTLYFFSGQNQLWKSDGTPSGTTEVAQLPNDYPYPQATGSLTAVGNEVYFYANNSLYRSDGTAAWTVAVAPEVTNALTIGAVPVQFYSMADVDGSLFFTASDGDTLALEKIDPATGAAVVVQTFDGTPPQNTALTAVNNQLYFIADDGVHGPAIWEATPTTAPVMVYAPVSEATPDQLGSVLYDFNNALYFSDPAFDSGLFTVDPNSQEVTEVSTESASNMIGVGSNLYFQHEDSFGSHVTTTLWLTDGQPTPGDNAMQVGGDSPQSGLWFPNYYTDTPQWIGANGLLYFIGEAGSNGEELWQADGATVTLADPTETPSGVTDDGTPVQTPNGWSPEEILGQTPSGLVFFAADPQQDSQLWELSGLGTSANPPTTTPTPPPPTTTPTPPPPTVQSTPPSPPVPPSTLVPMLGRVSLAPQVVAGSKLNARVPVVIVNGEAALKGKVTVDLYADTGTTLAGSPVLVASEARRVSLKANQKASFAFNVKSLPASVTNGTYHLVAQVIDPSGGSNVVATTQTLQVLARIVKPAVSIMTVTPGSNAAGHSESVVITVTNQGNAASTGGQITLALQASNTGVLTDVTLDGTRLGLIIPPGKSRRFRLRFKIPSALPAGTYFPQALVSLNGVSATAVSSLPLTVS